MAVDLSSHLNKSPDRLHDENYESVTSNGVIINALASKQKDTVASNYFSLNSFMEQSPAIPESPLVIHRHTPNNLMVGDTSKSGYFSSNTNPASPPFQRVGVNGSSFINSHSPQRTDFEMSTRQQQQPETILLSHTGMFDPTSATTTSNAYNHAFGVFGSNGTNLHSPVSMMNGTVELRQSSMQSLQPHPFYSHSQLTASHDQNTVQRSTVSPLLGNPMGYRAYPQISDLFPPRAEFYAQQTPFGHPQYW